MSRFHSEEERLTEEENSQAAAIASNIKIDRQKKLCQEQREAYDEQVKTLAMQVAETTLDYGEDHYLTHMMVMFLEMAVQMQETIKVMTASQEAILTIQKAMGVVKSALNFNMQVAEFLTEQPMGFFARLRRSRKMRKANRNTVNSIITVFKEVMNYSKMAQNMAEAMRSVSESMQRSTARARKRQMKRQAKMSGKAAASGAPAAPSPVQALIDHAVAELKAKRGGGSAPAVSAPAAASTAGTSGGVSGIDDIA